MTHALTTTPETVAAQPTTDEQGRRIYGTTLPPSKRIDVQVRFWREDDPEVWPFSARPKLDVKTLRRVGGLMQMSQVQQYREQARTASSQAKARQQLAAARAGEEAPPAPAVEPGEGMLPEGVMDAVTDILGFVGGMMSDRDGVSFSWDPDPTRHILWGTEDVTDEHGKPAPTWVDQGKDVIPPPADTPSWARGTFSIRMPDGTIVAGDDPRVADAQRLENASSKRRWHRLVVLDEDVDLGLDAIMELVGDLVGSWAGSEETPRPLDGPASSGSQPTSPESASGSPAVSP